MKKAYVQLEAELMNDGSLEFAITESGYKENFQPSPTALYYFLVQEAPDSGEELFYNQCFSEAYKEWGFSEGKTSLRPHEVKKTRKSILNPHFKYTPLLKRALTERISMDYKDKLFKKAIDRYLIKAATLAALKEIEEDCSDQPGSEKYYKNLRNAEQEERAEREGLLELGCFYYADHPEVIAHLNDYEAVQPVRHTVEFIIVKYIFGEEYVFLLGSPKCLAMARELNERRNNPSWA